MSNILSWLCHNRALRTGRAIADGKRWMIRGVDREIRKAVKDAARAEGISVGTWARRSLVRGLDASADGPATVMEPSKQVRLLGARLSLLKKSHRALHRDVHAADRPTANSARERRWRPTKKSK
jgi:outer membrane murein-binding lipoprotein Lpp